MLTMRASISRGSVTAPDSYGLTTPRIKDVKPVAENVPCYVRIKMDTEFVDGKSVSVERMRGYFRRGVDVQRLDVITQVTDRRGQVLYEGPIMVESVVPTVSRGVVSQFQAELRRVRGT